MKLMLVVALLGGSMMCIGAEEPVQVAPAWTPMRQVRLEGRYGAALAKSLHRLILPPLNDAGYVLADVTLDRNRIFTEYSGDISGRYIGVLAHTGSPDPNRPRLAEQLVEAIVAHQKPDGHFGADQKLPQLTRQVDMPILWGNGRMLIGLVEVAEETGNATALAAARKLGDYFVATDGVYCRKENLQAVGGTYSDAFATCYFSCIEGLVGLSRLTKDARYLGEAKRIADLAFMKDAIDGYHAHGRLTTLRGVLEIYLATREVKWLNAVEREWKVIYDKHRLATGGIKEIFSKECDRDEGCAVADWLRLNLLLWRATGKASYLDEAEWCLKNHFLWQQFANGGSGHRGFEMIDGQPIAFKAGGADAYWCCSEHWPRAMIDVARCAVTQMGGGVSVNLLVDAASQVKVGDVGWQVRLNDSIDRVSIRASLTNPTLATMRVRRPAWAKAATLSAPGYLTVEENADNWTISGRWEKDNQLSIELNRSVQVVRNGSSPAVLAFGDEILAAFPCPRNGWLLQGSNIGRMNVVVPENELRDAPIVIASALTQGRPRDRVSRLMLLESLRVGGTFQHRARFGFTTIGGGARDMAAVIRQEEPMRKGIWAMAATTTPSWVYADTQFLGECRDALQPLEAFAAGAERRQILIFCRPDPNSLEARVLCNIVATPGEHELDAMNQLQREADERRLATGVQEWQMKAITEREAQDVAAVMKSEGWMKATILADWPGPTRENRMTAVEDMQGKWITGTTTPDRPIIVFRCAL